MSKFMIIGFDEDGVPQTMYESSSPHRYQYDTPGEAMSVINQYLEGCPNWKFHLMTISNMLEISTFERDTNSDTNRWMEGIPASNTIH